MQNSKDWAKVYRACNFIEKGVCEYANERVYVSQEALQKSLHTMKGRPVIIDHTTGITPENMHEHAVGYVVGADHNTFEAGCDCQFVIFDDKGKEVIADGYSVSCAYKPLAFGPGGTWHNVPYDREIVELEFTHLALVQNPRYEDAKVYENSKSSDENGRWITVKGSRVFIKEGQSIEDAMKDRRKDKSLDQKTSKRKAKLEKIKNEVQSEIEKIYADYEDLKEYFVVDTRFKKNYYDDGSDMYAIEVRGELDYKSMTQLGDKLDKTVQKYDKYAYFDQEEPGIMTAVIDFDSGVEKHNAKDRNGDDGRWITIKGTHVFIKDGQSVEDAIDKKFKGSEGHEAKRTSKIHQDIHDRYEALREETERQKKELKGKYEREDADFDEEQALKDIEEARSFGYETIDDVAEFLGLDPDEVMGLTGESYGDGDDFNYDKLDKNNKYSVVDGEGEEERVFDSYEEAQAYADKLKKLYKEDGIDNPSIDVDEVSEKGEYVRSMPQEDDSSNQDSIIEEQLDKLYDKIRDAKRRLSKTAPADRKTQANIKQEIKDLESMYDYKSAKLSKSGVSNWSKSKYGNDWQLDQGNQTAKVSAKKDDGYAAKLWDSSTGKISEQKSFETKEDAMRWAEGKLKDKKQSSSDKEGFKKFVEGDKEKNIKASKKATLDRIEELQKESGWYGDKDLNKIKESLQRTSDWDEDTITELATKFGEYESKHKAKVKKFNTEKHNSKEDTMNVEEFFNKMGEIIEEKFNACKGKMNEADEEEKENDDDDKFEMDGEVYSKKELVNAFKEKKNAEDAAEEEEKQNSGDEFFNAMEQRMLQYSEESDRVEVYTQRKGLERGKEIYGK